MESMNKIKILFDFWEAATVKKLVDNLKILYVTKRY